MPGAGYALYNPQTLLDRIFGVSWSNLPMATIKHCRSDNGLGVRAPALGWERVRDPWDGKGYAILGHVYRQMFQVAPFPNNSYQLAPNGTLVLDDAMMAGDRIKSLLASRRT